MSLAKTGRLFYNSSGFTYTTKKGGYGMGWIMSLIIGGIAGWLAGEIMKNRGGMLRNIVLGIVGGVVGNVVLGAIGISGHGVLGSIIVSVIGACIIIWLGNSLFGRR